MILFIDSSGFHELHFALIPENGRAKEKIYKIDQNKTAKTLFYFTKFFGKTKWNGIKKIIVVSGPGSFSGIRAGLSMALAFSLAKDIPVYATSKKYLPKSLSALHLQKKGLQKLSSGFEPEYGAEPNITLK